LTMQSQTRRHFFQAASVSTLAALPLANAADDSPRNVFGPRPGFSPQIGTLVSEMTWMRGAVIAATKGMTTDQLDFLLDNKANRIGALLFHLAATEKLYQLNTFENADLSKLETNPAFKDFGVAMDLGEPARQSIKGHNLDFYLNLLEEGRQKTLAEFRKRDDAWLMSIDKTWGWGPTNNLCKWFHVTEHESHHTGQISLLASRAPKATPSPAG